MADYSYVGLYGCRPKSVSISLASGLGCMPALSVTHCTAAAVVCGLWCSISYAYAFLLLLHVFKLIKWHFSHL